MDLQWDSRKYLSQNLVETFGNLGEISRNVDEILGNLDAMWMLS